MANNINEKNIRNLFDNIEKQLLSIDFKKQNCLIEMDILLEKTRHFYEECVLVRSEIEQSIATKKAETEKHKLNIPSLFGEEWEDEPNNINETPQQEIHKIENTITEQEQEKTPTPTNDPIVAENTTENIDHTELPSESEEPIKEEIVSKTTDNDIQETNTSEPEISQHKPIEEPIIEPKQTQENLLNKKTIVETETETNSTELESIENGKMDSNDITPIIEEQTLEEDDDGKSEIAIDDSMFDIFNTTDIPMESSATTTTPNKIHDEIDLDNIEFEEEPQVVERNQHAYTSTEERPNTHQRRTPPAYWGDEIEIENPIPIKNVSISEKYQQSRPSVNDMVSGLQHNDTLGLSFGQGNSDLMNSIDINNKFLFVKELFKNNGSLFTEEINKLNDFKHLTDMLPYLDKLKQKYNWKEDSEAYQALYRLLLKKFSTKHK